MPSSTFLGFSFVFHNKICVYIIFIAFLNEVSNFWKQSETRIGDPKLLVELYVYMFLLAFISLNHLSAKQAAFADDFTVAAKLITRIN